MTREEKMQIREELRAMTTQELMDEIDIMMLGGYPEERTECMKFSFKFNAVKNEIVKRIEG